MAYNVGVIGTGYVGLVSGTCFAETGNDVYCVDIVDEKVEMLKKGIAPIFEPGLDRYLKKNLEEGRLRFTTNLEDAVVNCRLIFLCLPTPPNEDGSADLQHVLKCAEDIAGIILKKKLDKDKIIINKSTVPVDTADKVREIFDRMIPGNKIEVVSNPEFLREGFAVEDALKPERVVIGTTSKHVEEIMRDLYEPFVRSGNPILVMDIKSAEVTKYAANSFLAAKISFMNDLSEYCEKVGADIENIRIGIGSDSRIGKRFLFAGIGYGGSCFPKDVKALIHSTDSEGTSMRIVKAAQEVNENQIRRFFNLILKRFDGNIKDKQFALWGLAFKPNTDDIREAPAFKLIDMFLEHAAKVRAYDSEAMSNTKQVYGDRISYATGIYDCIENADALVIATEWNLFRKPDFGKLKTILKNPVIFDGRNLYNLDEMAKLGFEYYCIGRKRINSNIKD
ncbi:MAG: UDP-glucose 6-dehydrogenase [Ignavibacteria bacterium GWB2_35_12]|nr:MAG: UDP-glucose 6-dehydrogenase [Ignavibacteria bacterium GWB2_35_12]OGU95882.1 MAG: UDP-glucose 6-dehydrogenase [Ignavibacteria bacterium RIFOXYA2_FULL_35_10]OGV20650.1 MAG: UDP-glucose 6-dehydrogenase [Ignavibacteria bacterium RIFOXYC2_FULL_35_21]